MKGICWGGGEKHHKRSSISPLQSRKWTVCKDQIQGRSSQARSDCKAYIGRLRQFSSVRFCSAEVKKTNSRPYNFGKESKTWKEGKLAEYSFSRWKETYWSALDMIALTQVELSSPLTEQSWKVGIKVGIKLQYRMPYLVKTVNFSSCLFFTILYPPLSKELRALNKTPSPLWSSQQPCEAGQCWVGQSHAGSFMSQGLFS